MNSWDYGNLNFLKKPSLLRMIKLNVLLFKLEIPLRLTLKIVVLLLPTIQMFALVIGFLLHSRDSNWSIIILNISFFPTLMKTHHYVISHIAVLLILMK